MKPSFDKKENYLYIYGDEAASHGKVVEIFDLVRKVGIQRIFIETERKTDDF